LQDAGEAIATGDLGRAERDLQFLVRTSGEDYYALDLLGIVRAQQQQNAEAEEIFQRVIKTNPDFPSAHINLGLLYIQKGQPEAAVPQLQEGLRLAPERTDAATALATIWRGQAQAAITAGDTEKALSLLIQARKVTPDDAEVQFEFGMVALRMSLLPDAIDGFQRSLKVRPTDTKALYGLGRAFMESSKIR
jgi:predicted Zn-dependent protease